MLVVSKIKPIELIRLFDVESDNPINSAAQTLREQYKHQRLVEFSLLDYATDMPFLDVAMKTRNELTIPVWTFIESIESYYAPSSKNNEVRILISGHPGAGKTTLMRYLAKEWAEGRALQSCQILFLFHLDGLSKERKPQSLSDLLHMSPHKDLKGLKQISEEIQSSHGAGVCFLLDAYDEWHWTNDLSTSCFFGNILHSSICILTSRPNFYEERDGINIFEVVGFSGINMQRYLHSMASDEHVTRSVLDVWRANPNIKDMCKLPLNMVMVVFIAKHDRIFALHTKTQLYLAFMNVTVKHYLNQHPEWNTVSLRECILNKAYADDKLCTAFQHLHHAAFEMHFNGMETFPEDLKIKNYINKLGFVSVTKVNPSLDQVKYKYFHPTFLDFFAAIHLLSLPQEDRLYFYIKEQSGRQVNHNLWLFFFGLISAHYTEDIYSCPLSTILRQFSMFYGEYQMEQFVESPSHCHCGKLLEYIHEIQWTGKDLSDLLVSAGIVSNSSLCVEKVTTLSELNAFNYLLDNINIHNLKFKRTHGYFDYLTLSDSSEVHAHHLEPLINCFNSSNDLSIQSSAAGFNIHVDVWNTTDKAVLECLIKTATNLTFLHIGLRGLDTHYLSTALLQVRQRTQNLQTMSLNIEINCDHLPMVVSEITNFSSIVNLELNIDLAHSYGFEGYDTSCRKAASVLGTLKHPNKLQNLTLVLPRAYFRSSQHEVILHRLTGLKHLRVIFDRSGSDTDCYKLSGEISELKNLESLEVRNCHFGKSKSAYYLPHTLQELTLDENDLNDEDVSVLVELINLLPNIKTVSLPNNFITGSGVNILVGALKSHREFTSLDLSGNPITERKGLGTLSELSNLRELKLSNCSIGDTEIEILVTSLESNSNLRSLNLSGNPFIESEHGLEPLARMTNLHHLDISGSQHRYGHCHMQFDEGCYSIIENHTLIKLLKNLTQLRFLKLCSKYDPPIYWSKEMASVISQLPHLQVFNAPCLQT